MVTDFDMSLFLIFQSLAVSGVGQEQAHFLTLPANRRVMGKNIKDDHVSGRRVETLQSHNEIVGAIDKNPAQGVILLDEKK